MDYQKTGQVISSRRQELGLTQKQLARRLSISDRTVSRWERGVGFPDVSLLEPLADALGLSLGELIRGERLPPAQQPSPEAEQEVRAAAIGLGGYLRQALRRTQRLLTVLSVLLACALAGLLLLWLNPFQVYSIDTQPVSAAQAAKICPTAMITQDEFWLAARLLENEEVAKLLSDPESTYPYGVDLSPDLVDDSLLQIDGQPAQCAAIYVVGQGVLVSYTAGADGNGGQPNHMCILTIIADGDIIKSTCRYRSGKTVYLVESFGNTSFTLSRQHRDLLYFLHEY